MMFYTPDEFKHFISAAKEYCEQTETNGSLYEWNYYVFFNIAFYMGMRKGEIYALQWSDIKCNDISITKKFKSEAQRLRPGNTAEKSKFYPNYWNTDTPYEHSQRTQRTLYAV